MSKRKSIKTIEPIEPIEPTTSKIWRASGPEQKLLNSMFSGNKIKPAASPDSVKKSNVIFKGFSSAVFATHFRNTKAKLGLCATVSGEGNAGSSVMPELKGFFTDGQGLSDSPSDSPSDCLLDRPQIRLNNVPFWTWTYSDHKKNLDFVCVALVVFSGSRNINFIMSEDGTQITVRYVWPTAIYKAVELFKHARQGPDKLTIHHPKIHSFASHVEENGITNNSNPHGEIIIDLPQRVQRDPKTWKRQCVQENNTNIMLLEFATFQKSLIVDDADTSMNFP